jgi:hypothetical protein
MRYLGEGVDHALAVLINSDYDHVLGPIALLLDSVILLLQLLLSRVL